MAQLVYHIDTPHDLIEVSQTVDSYHHLITPAITEDLAAYAERYGVSTDKVSLIQHPWTAEPCRFLIDVELAAEGRRCYEVMARSLADAMVILEADYLEGLVPMRVTINNPMAGRFRTEDVLFVGMEGTTTLSALLLQDGRRVTAGWTESQGVYYWLQHQQGLLEFPKVGKVRYREGSPTPLFVGFTD